MGISPLVTVIATRKLGKRTSKLVYSSTEIALARSRILYVKNREAVKKSPTYCGGP
ncbi:MAG: hypothetical protein BECKG1743D_GA0114223_100469 [Candidatus Kentron sp. G]|nr:MAG: hypothetical protein BECKG1743E_GA0114224_100427 [Candidatus Kentron sp. G]VFM98131.1 MAG: hypothetical protein BECKG1743D_GA0114223_100469 [Candidatus Kentron sp. G]